LVWFYICITRLPVTVKLVPADPDGLRRRRFETANGACDGISEQAWHPKTFRQLALDKGVYYQVRERFGWSAQMAVRAIAKLVDAYALDKRTKRMFRIVDPRNTSRTCSTCGYCEKGNRGNQSDFGCRSCRRQAHADINAAENIRQGRCKEAERDVVQNRQSHSFRFRRLSAAVTSPRL
jgi:Putative transposase DNA-binding domain